MLLSYTIQCKSLFACQTSRQTLVELMRIKTKPSWVDACFFDDLSNVCLIQTKKKQRGQLLFFVDISLKAQMTLLDTLRF